LVLELRVKEATFAKNATVQIEGGVRLVPFDAQKGTSYR
jgi:hypothetical protein